MDNKEKLKSFFDRPKLMALVADVNTGKSNFLYWMLETLREEGEFSLYHYGFRTELPFGQEIFQVEELEVIQNSLIVCDEVMSMWDLENRKKRMEVEDSLRLLNHNNNILLISALPDNMKQFISNKVESWFFKKVTIGDFVNGSRGKKLMESYSGPEKGSKVVNVPTDKALAVENHWTKLDIPYMEKYDTKATNKPIIDFSKKKQSGNRKKQGSKE